MDTAQIIAGLKAERDRLTDAIDALIGNRNGRRRRRPGPKPGKNRKRRHLSAAAKRRISEAAKARWAKAKKAGKNRL